uniref:Uncharacterized protein n=1 Tax=Micrurus lemniscatus lemniscatus TaxID=129467 RepID=A0A2D4IPE3_MICLE
MFKRNIACRISFTYKNFINYRCLQTYDTKLHCREWGLKKRGELEKNLLADLYNFSFYLSSAMFCSIPSCITSAILWLISCCWSDVICYVNFISGDCSLVFGFRVLHGANLEGHLEASAGAKYGCMDSFMCL